MVFDGDSLTQSSPVDFTKYPPQAYSALGSPGTAYNVAVGGRTIVTMAANASASVDSKYVAGRQLQVVVIWGGTNDIATGATAADTYANIKAYCEARKALGWRVIALSMLPRIEGGATTETKRQALNALLRADFPTTVATNILSGASWADLLVDVGNDSTVGQAGQNLNTTYYEDGTHMMAAGYGIIARYVKDAIRLLQ